MAYGTYELKADENPLLGLTLNKIHTNQTRIDRSRTRSRVVRNVAKERGRHPVYMPQTSVCMCWNSELDETVQANVVMGDVSEGLSRMLATSGVDKDLLTSTYIIEFTKHTLTYTNDDK